MANSIPLLEGTDAAGGFLARDNLSPGVVFQRGINRQSAVASLANIRPVSGKRERMTEYVGRPTAAFVAEAAAKPVTGAEYAEVTLDIKKIASTVLFSKELLEDVVEDPTPVIAQDVRAAIADLIDSHALGWSSAGAIVSQFNSELMETTSSVELGAGPDALAIAISTAMETVEANGYVPNGVILARDGGAHLRAARDADGRPLYTEGFAAAPSSMYGVPVRYSTNLQSFSGAPAVGRKIGLVGDFSGAMLAVRKDVEFSFSDQATVDVGGVLHNLWQQNKVGVLWETRLGFVAHDLNRRFVAITNGV